MRESRIEANLRKAVEKAGGRCLKLPSMWYVGIPDRIVLLPGGRVFFIELKKAKAKPPTRWQKRWRVILSTMGFNSYIMKGMEEVQEFIDLHIGEPSA